MGWIGGSSTMDTEILEQPYTKPNTNFKSSKYYLEMDDDQMIKQQASTAEPKGTVPSKLNEERMKAVRRERMGRSHAPTKKVDEASQDDGDVEMFTATAGGISQANLLFQNKKLDNFSNEKTSATGSHESNNDSP